jgi:predicted secreted protein
MPLPDGVTLLTKRFAQRAPSSVGEGGAQVFEMQAQRPGRMQVRFALKRRWEPTPVEIHTVDIDVG